MDSLLVQQVTAEELAVTLDTLEHKETSNEKSDRLAVVVVVEGVVVVGAGSMALESRKTMEFAICGVEQTVQIGLLELTDSVFIGAQMAVDL